jgi:uncharacterized protein (UPF0332 family)
MTEKDHERIKKLLGRVPSVYFQKSLENYSCFEAEMSVPAMHTSLSRLYYSLYLACKGNLYIKVVKGVDEFVEHKFMVDQLKRKHSNDSNIMPLLVWYNPLFGFRKRSDYDREILSMTTPMLKTVMDGGTKLLENITNKTISELNAGQA